MVSAWTFASRSGYIPTMFSIDQALIEKAKQGDNAAFGMLWERYEPCVVSLCRRFLAGPYRDPAVDEHDLATYTFIRALHRLDQYHDREADGAGFDDWLLTVARRICLSFLARQKRRQRWSAAPLDEWVPEPLDPASTAEHVVESREVLRLASLQINALPDHYRAPFKLFLEEYSQKEISQALGISPECAAKRVQRARRLLQPRMAELLGVHQGAAPVALRRRRASLRGVEIALTEVVSDHRIVTIKLSTGGEMQLCLRVDRRVADRGPEIERLRSRLRGSPRAWRGRLELAELCYQSGDWEAARDEYRAVLASNPACFGALLRLGDMLHEEQDAPEAAEHYRTALQQPLPPARSALLRGRLLAAERKDEEAVAAFREAIALDPREKAGYYGLCQVLGRLSRYEEQLQALEALRELDGEDMYGLVGVYTPCARLGRFELARSFLERAVALDPHHPRAIKHLFQARMNLGLCNDETLQLAERLVKLAPEFVESWGELAWIYSELGRDAEALAVLRHFLESHPNNAEAHAALAWRCHYLGLREEEVVHACRAYELQPHCWYICWTLLTAYNAASPSVSEGEALAFAGQIAARFPHDSAALQSVAGLYGAYGREADAIDYGRRAVALNPASVEAQMCLAGIYRRFHHWEHAARMYECLVEQRGCQKAGILSAWGSALKRLNDPRAQSLLDQAWARATTTSDYLDIGHTLQSYGLKDEAVAAFRRCLDHAPVAARTRLSAEAALQRLAAVEKR